MNEEYRWLILMTWILISLGILFTIAGSAGRKPPGPA